MQSEITREWVTYKQAEELSGLSRTTLWKLINTGEVEAARVGRAVRLNRGSLTAYMKRSAVNVHEVSSRVVDWILQSRGDLLLSPFH